MAEAITDQGAKARQEATRTWLANGPVLDVYVKHSMQIEMDE